MLFVALVFLNLPTRVCAGDPLSLNEVVSRDLPTGIHVHIIQLLSLRKMQKTSQLYLHKLLDVLNLPGAKFTCSELDKEYVLGISTNLQVFTKVQVLAYKAQLQKILYDQYTMILHMLAWAMDDLPPCYSLLNCAYCRNLP